MYQRDTGMLRFLSEILFNSSSAYNVYMEFKWEKSFDLMSLELQQALWDLDSFLSKHPNLIPAQREIERDLAAIGDNPSERLKYFVQKIQEKKELLEDVLKTVILESSET